MTSLKTIQQSDPGTVHKIVWRTGPSSLRAAMRVSLVHLVTPESVPRTLCGRMVPLPSKHVVPYNEAECVRCAAKVAS